MNNYYPYNAWHMAHISNQAPRNIYRVTANRRFELEVDGATREDLGNGFIRYSWSPPTQINVLINPFEYIDLRLNAKQNQQVISAGFSTDPLEDIYIVQMHPRHPHVMAVFLRSRAFVGSWVGMWLIVKE